jgi:hypothetical protein
MVKIRHKKKITAGNGVISLEKKEFSFSDSGL